MSFVCTATIKRTKTASEISESQSMSFVFRDLFPDERSYRLGEVASRLGVHVDTVRRWTNDGRLDSFRVHGQRRIPFIALQSFASARQQKNRQT